MVATQIKQFKTQKTTNSRIKSVNFKDLLFGATFSDHMFVANCIDGVWQEPSIIPYGNTPMTPALSGLHYGQSIFEGLKAYRNNKGIINLFRIDEHYKRMNRSAERLCMPAIPADYFIEGTRQVIKLDKDWVPNEPGSSLYIRPFYFATDEFIGMRPSQNYTFITFTCPVNPYYTGAVKVFINTESCRAFEGGTGFVKMAGNYANSMQASQIAKDNGYNVVLWLDAKERKYIEEFSTMNAFFVINGTAITPPTSGTILQGITRDCLVTLLKNQNIPHEVRPISIDEILDAQKKGTLQEAFGAGTAASVAPVEYLDYNKHRINLPPYSDWKIAPLLQKTISNIRFGQSADIHNWLSPIE